MGTYRSKKRGSVKIEGVVVPFDAGCNVTEIADQLTPKIIGNLVDAFIWEDVTAEISEAQKQMSLQLSKVEKAKKAKAKK